MIAGNSISLRLFIVFTTIALCGMGRWAKADGGGNVMPASARPLGYSLTAIAADTSHFNTGPRTADTLPDVPFQLLYVPFNSPLPTQNTFTVSQGTHFYVPVFFADDSPPVIGDFPGDVSDRQADADYLLDADVRRGNHDRPASGWRRHALRRHRRVPHADVARDTHRNSPRNHRRRRLARPGRWANSIRVHLHNHRKVMQRRAK